MPQNRVMRYRPGVVYSIDVGANIRTARLAAGLSQSEVAGRLGLRQTWVSDLECGRRGIWIGNLIRLAEAIGCEPGDLLRRQLVLPLARPDPGPGE